MRRRVLWLLCASVLLSSCSQESTAPKDLEAANSESQSDNDAESDKNDHKSANGDKSDNDSESGSDARSDAAELSAVLGSTPPYCPEGTPPGNASCRQLLDLSAKLVGYVDTALKDMPKTDAYKEISKAIDDFEDAYQVTRRCFEPGAKQKLGNDPRSEKACSALTATTAATWIMIEQAIRDLEQSG